MIYAPNVLKQCTQCKQYFLATRDYFYRDRKMAGGLTYACSSCLAEKSKQRYAQNPELHKQYVKASKTKKKKPLVVDNLPQGFKRCKTCKEVFPATREYFHSDKTHADGLHARCKSCRCDWINKQRAENPEQQKALRQRFYANNKDRVKKKVRDYVDRNREKRAEYEREYWKQNVDKRQAKHVRRKAAKKRLPNTFTAQDWERCLDYWNHRCAVCGRAADETTVLSPDHWIALTDPREDNPGTVPTNIVPLCGSLKGGRNGCNNSKHKRNAVTWLIEKYGEDEAQVILGWIRAYFESLG